MRLSLAAYRALGAELTAAEAERRELLEELQSLAVNGDQVDQAFAATRRGDLDRLDWRMAELKRTRLRAEIVEPGGRGPAGVVAQGRLVSMRFKGEPANELVLVGERAEKAAAGPDVMVVSPQSPLGRALRGKKVGDIVRFDRPSDGRQVVAKVMGLP